MVESRFQVRGSAGEGTLEGLPKHQRQRAEPQEVSSTPGASLVVAWVALKPRHVCGVMPHRMCLEPRNRRTRLRELEVPNSKPPLLDMLKESRTQIRGGLGVHRAFKDHQRSMSYDL